MIVLLVLQEKFYSKDNVYQNVLQDGTLMEIVVLLVSIHANLVQIIQTIVPHVLILLFFITINV